jgi:hypothetical protein
MPVDEVESNRRAPRYHAFQSMRSDAGIGGLGIPWAIAASTDVSLVRDPNRVPKGVVGDEPFIGSALV